MSDKLRPSWRPASPPPGAGAVTAGAGGYGISLILELRDLLAEALGARAPGETLRYTFDDAVRLAGHSCPTIAGAWLMTAAALRALYGDAMPVRGEIAVVVGATPDDNSLGPMAQVFALVTGAADRSGFAGLAGKWRRRGLLTFDPALGGRVRFSRLDTGETVDVGYSPASISSPPGLYALLPDVLAGRADDDERRLFGLLWQQRVEAILANGTALVEVERMPSLVGRIAG